MKAYYLLIICVCWSTVLVGQPSAGDTGISGAEVINSFLKEKENNYPHVPLVHKTILTECESFDQGNKLYSNVAEIEYLRYGYHSEGVDGMKIISGKHLLHDELLSKDPLVGGLAQIRKDIVKYPREFLDPSLGFYYYTIKSIETPDSSVYKVSFLPLNRKAKYQGDLFFDTRNFALLKAEYSFTDEGIKALNRINGGEIVWKQMKETLVYGRPKEIKPYLDEYDRYHLSEISTIGISEHPKLEKDMEVVSELTVLDINRTTFFANEYYQIDDQAALSAIDYEKIPPIETISSMPVELIDEEEPRPEYHLRNYP